MDDGCWLQLYGNRTVSYIQIALDVDDAIAAGTLNATDRCPVVVMECCPGFRGNTCDLSPTPFPPSATGR